MNAICKRLCSRRGESLVESMAAILVLSFASLILISMIQSSGRINKTVKEDDDAFQEAQHLLEQRDTRQGGSKTTKTITITYGPEKDSTAETLATINVDFYQEETKPDADVEGLYAFYLPTEAAGGGS